MVGRDNIYTATSANNYVYRTACYDQQTFEPGQKSPHINNYGHRLTDSPFDDMDRKLYSNLIIQSNLRSDSNHNSTPLDKLSKQQTLWLSGNPLQ